MGKMFRKLFVVFIFAAMYQDVSAQVIGAYERSLGVLPWSSVVERLLGPGTPVFGRSFAVTSSSPIAPRGVTITSESYYDGVLRIVGQVPFLSTVTVEGAVPSVGVGAITYGCAGDVAMLSEDVAEHSYSNMPVLSCPYGRTV